MHSKEILMFNPSKKKSILIISCVALIIAILIFSWKIWQSRGSEIAVGSYITSNGDGYIVIEKDFLWGLKVKEAMLPLGSYTYFQILSVFHSTHSKNYNRKYKVSFSDGILSIKQHESFMSPEGNLMMKMIMQLKPSKGSSTEWDIVKCDHKISGNARKTFLSIKFWRDAASGSFWNFMYDLLSTYKIMDIETLSLDPSKSPVKYYLHRIDDPLLADYFKARYNGDTSLSTLQIIRKIVSNHPEDVYINLHLIELETINGNTLKAKNLLKKWKSRNKKPINSMLDQANRRVSQTVTMAIIEENHPDLLSFFETFKNVYSNNKLTTETNLDKQLELCGKLLETDMLISYPDALVYPYYLNAPMNYDTPGFLKLQVFAKVSRTVAMLYLFQGKRQECLKLLASLYRLGQSLNSTGELICRLIGIAVRSIALSGLELYVLNVCENPEEFNEFFIILERLKNTPGQVGSDCLFEEELSSLSGKMLPVSSRISKPDHFEPKIRHNVADMKFQLLRMAAAAKYHYVKTGKFPETDKDFNIYLASGIPEDDFAATSHLQYSGSNPDHFKVYSIGPDKKDNRASHRYDPTNGTISDGDIIIDIPAEKEYPFPKEPVKAANAYKLLEQFPNGLPPDAFSDTRFLPLSIIESTDDHPVTIFSFGPNTDEYERLRGHLSRSGLDLHTTETARLLMKNLHFGTRRINPEKKKNRGSPTPTPAPPVPTPDPGENPSYGRSLQKVFWRTEDNNFPLGFTKLEAYYDPTNGTISEGDLFIEIPKR
jgi:hypothetical protein